MANSPPTCIADTMPELYHVPDPGRTVGISYACANGHAVRIDYGPIHVHRDTGIIYAARGKPAGSVCPCGAPTVYPAHTAPKKESKTAKITEDHAA